MGLDMYLSKRTYVKRWDHIPAEEQFSVVVKQGGKRFHAIKPERISYIEEQVGYWRKANQIHNWFVENVQNGVDDCGSYPVSEEQLQALLETVNGCLADPSKAKELLPPAEGFFFGSTELDEWYWQDLEHTKKLLTELLAEPQIGFGSDYSYRSSW